MGKDLIGYVQWVDTNRGHAVLFSKISDSADRYESFDNLYRIMGEQIRVNKLVRFNYLSMIGNLGIVDIMPGSLYLSDFLWAKKGAKGLFSDKTRSKISSTDLNRTILCFALHLDSVFGCQILRAALGEWAKDKFGQESKNFRRY